MYQLFNIIFATFFIIVATSGQSLAPLIKFENVTIIEDEYLVMLHKEYSLVSHFEHIGLDLSEVSSKFRAIPLINGYSARLTADVVHNIRSDSGVRVVEHNFMIKGMEPMSTGNATIPMDDSGLNKRWSYYYQTQPWHIAMLTAGKKLSVPLPDQSTVTYLQGGGQGVNVYVLDSGVRITHSIFKRGGAINFKNYQRSPYTDSPMTDNYGHGTHVAGIVAQNAPWATIVNVKIANGRGGGSYAMVLTAMGDVVAEHNSNRNSPPSGWRGSVINLSINLDGIPLDLPLEAVIYSMYEAGIPVVTSAGNNQESRGGLPCGLYHMICVASCDRTYVKSWFSNYGEGVNMIAPGNKILSADYRSDNQLVSMDGTSMSAPAVAGILAIFVGFEALVSNIQKATTRLTQNMIRGVVSGLDPKLGLANSGINNPYKDETVPYLGAPGRELSYEGDPNTAVDGPIGTVAASDLPSYTTVTDDTFEGNFPSGFTPTTGSTASTPIPSWVSYMAECNDTGVDYGTAYTLLLRVAMSTTLNQCIPQEPDSEDCVNLDTSQVAPVNDQTFDLCGPPGACANYSDIFNGAQSLVYNCNGSQGISGSVQITPDVTIEM